MRVIPGPNGGNRLFLYAAHLGKWVITPITSTSIGPSVGGGTIDPNYTDVTFWQDMDGSYNGHFMKEEGRIVFDYRRIARMANRMHEEFGGGKTMGYQFGLMQSGRVIHVHSGGYSSRSEGILMDNGKNTDVGSVSKMVTTATILKRIELGQMSLDDKISDWLPLPTTTPHEEYRYLPANEVAHPTNADIRLIELLTHTGRLPTSSATDALWAGGRNEAGCNEQLFGAQWSFDPAQPLRCNRGYQNSNTTLLGYMVGAEIGVINTPTPPEDGTLWDTYQKQLWMDDAFAFRMVCGPPDGNTSKQYQYVGCTSGADCFDGYRERTPDPGGPIMCAAGSWKASSESLLQMMAAFRYRKVFGPEMHDLLFTDDLLQPSGGTPAVGWNFSSELMHGEYEYGKDGVTGGVSSFVHHLPWGIDAVYVGNTNPCNGCGSRSSVMKEGFLEGSAL